MFLKHGMFNGGIIGHLGVIQLLGCFKKAFLDRFFPREMRKSKVVEFINLLQGGMCAHKYTLKFTKLSKCAPVLVSDLRDEMSLFVMGVLDNLQEECHSAMIHKNMNISHLVVITKHVEEARSKNKSKDAKWVRYFDRVSSKNRLEIEDKPTFKKRISYQVPFKLHKAIADRLSNLKPKKLEGTNSPTEKQTCRKCGKRNYGDSLKRTDNFFGCGKSGNKVSYFYLM